MLDIKAIRENPGKFRKGILNRGGRHSTVLEELLVLDESRRKKLMETEALQAQRNQISKKIGEIKAKKQELSPELASEAESVKRNLETLEREAKEFEEKNTLLLLSLPNLPLDSVPVGRTPEDNPVARQWGEIPKFDFKPKDHQELGEVLGILDFASAAKLSGSRFALYKGKGAQLERALASFMLDLAASHGYQEIIPPFLVLGKALLGTGQLPKFEADLYKTKGEASEPDLYLIPTSEVPLVNVYREENIPEEKLPIAVTAWTPCFRSEAGTYGKDTRGLIRNHQFSKVELVRLCLSEKSNEELERLTGHAEEVLKKLGLPYRVVELCTGDLGFGSAKTYDLEVWMPQSGGWREISSCSNCGDFQARRASIRAARKNGKKEFVHTLNGSGLAVGRTLAAVLENFQRADGSVEIPQALRSYLPFSEIR